MVNICTALSVCDFTRKALPHNLEQKSQLCATDYQAMGDHNYRTQDLNIEKNLLSALEYLGWQDRYNRFWRDLLIRACNLSSNHIWSQDYKKKKEKKEDFSTPLN